MAWYGKATISEKRTEQWEEGTVSEGWRWADWHTWKQGWETQMTLWSIYEFNLTFDLNKWLMKRSGHRGRADTSGKWEVPGRKKRGRPQLITTVIVNLSFLINLACISKSELQVDIRGFILVLFLSLLWIHLKSRAAVGAFKWSVTKNWAHAGCECRFHPLLTRLTLLRPNRARKL